jgi:hypothetical protein
MALKSANQPIRWKERIRTWIKAAVFFILEVLGSFLNFRKEDGLLTRGKKTANLIVRRVSYLIADYYLMLVAAGIVSTMKYLGFAFVWAFAALWVFGIVVAGSFILFYEKTGEDLSLGSDLRRAADTVHRAISSKSRIAGLIAAVLVVLVQAILVIAWTGPEKTILFFRKEIGTVQRILVVLIVLTAIQSLIWTPIYLFGYDLVVKTF